MARGVRLGFFTDYKILDILMRSEGKRVRAQINRGDFSADHAASLKTISTILITN